MIVKFSIGLLIVLGVSFFGGVVLALIDSDETSKSILYDDPEYFKHDEPEWLRKEQE